jgi:hypothetical protein
MNGKLKIILYFILVVHLLSYCEVKKPQIKLNHSKPFKSSYTPDTICKKADDIYIIRHL